MKLSPIALRALLFTVVAFAAVLIGWQLLKPSGELPIYGPAQLNPELVAPELRHARGEHHIQEFHLIDQDGDSVSLATVKGKVVLADFFFTTCGSICPKMSTQLTRVQEAFKDDDRVLLLSHSVTPESDSVPVLKAYAERYDVDHRRWRLMTGDRKQIYRLARTSWFAAKGKGDGGPDDFVHTENFVLADTLGRLRGFYDGTSVQEVDRAIGDIKKLLGADPN